MTRENESSPWCSRKGERGCVSLKKDKRRAWSANKGGERERDKKKKKKKKREREKA